MAKVTKLAIALQSGTDNTYYASWEFGETTKSSTATTSSTAVKKGSLVTIKSGATYYNGVSIPSWVMSDRWYVTQITGDRAVLGKNASGSSNIQSPINTKYLTASGSSSGSGSSSSSENLTKTLDHYKVLWYYDTGDGIWFKANETDVKTKYDTYSPPENALKIAVKVKPVSKTYKSNNKDKSYWTGEQVTKTLHLASAPPADAGSPSVEIEKFKLTATLDNISDPRTDKIQFEVYNGTKKVKTGTVTVKACMATYTCAVTAGGSYRVRCRAINIYSGSNIYSEWSSFTSEQSTIPKAVTGVKAVADSETSVKITWKAANTATGYTVEYSTKKEYFDTSTSVQSTSVTATTAYITGLDSGETWFFRVKATNAKGDSEWSSIVSTVIGTKPEAPTTWSLTSSVIVGDEITLYWTHNSEDGSKQTAAQIYLAIGSDTQTITIDDIVEDADEDEPVYTYKFATTAYTEGANIRWKIRTKGAISDYGPWSTTRTIKLYAMPNLELTLPRVEGDTLTALPLDISLSSGPSTQKPLSYHIAITANRTYESVDIVGNETLVTAGSEVYSKTLITSSRWPIVSISAGDIILENNQTYTLTATVSMDSGLAAEVSLIFGVEWAEYDYMPDASIAIDFDTLSAYITPFCRDGEDEFVQDVTLSVYRREYDGTFTEIATGIRNNGVTAVTDPHPSLDYARYRIVAIDSTTGGVIYEDLPGEPIGEPSIVIQWDEAWSEFDYSEDDAPEVPPWNGSMVRIPYNVDVTENHRSDVALVEYIGREHPVSYYGTQRGVTASWSAEIVKSDKETLYALRRLSSWRGDVYVREPSGTGYWAQVTVSFPLKHVELTVPVTFDIVRVEGGV